MSRRTKFGGILSGISLVLLAACSGIARSPISETEGPPLALQEEKQARGSLTQTLEATAGPTANPLLPSSTAPSDERAGNADVLYVRAVYNPEGNSWTFHVTVGHPDKGWDDYADGWDIVTQDGTVIKPDPASPFTRLLLHPHENEQPFTRSQSGIQIPAGIEVVTVRAHDLVSGYGGKEVQVNLTMATGPDFEVSR